MAEHSIFSASGSKRWLTCPGSIKLSQKCPPSPDSAAAKEGTHAHSLAEMCFETGLSAYHFIGLETASGFVVTTPMAKHVQTYVDYVNRHQFELQGHKFIEQRVTLDHIDQRIFGTGDAIIISGLTIGKEVHIFDLKYGKWGVSVEDNTQMLFYAAGTIKKYKHIIHRSCNGVTAHICQPRVGPFTSTFFSMERLNEFEQQVREAVQEADKAEPKLLDGEHCRFCPAEFICPQLNKLGRMVT